ncbi:MAG: OmpA family protein [Bacteroidales bacterium]
MQKQYIYYLFVFMLLQVGASGQNLIPNAGFEGGWACPEDFTKEPVKELVPHWLNPNKGTPDYFHTCSDSMAGIPDNFAGHMPAHEGDAYIGLILREVFIDSVSPRKVSREYITVELNKPLEHRKLYCFKLHYALADRSSFAVDALGISFTRKKLKAWDAGLLDAEPLVYNVPGNIMKNKNQWHELCGAFRARGRENFLTIGNFCPNIKTHYYQATDSMADSSFVYAYYYIDDVKLYEIDHPFECGCLDELSQGYDWLDEDSKGFMEAYNDYLQQKQAEEMLAASEDIEGNDINSIDGIDSDKKDNNTGSDIDNTNEQDAGKETEQNDNGKEGKGDMGQDNDSSDEHDEGDAGNDTGDKKGDNDTDHTDNDKETNDQKGNLASEEKGKNDTDSLAHSGDSNTDNDQQGLNRANLTDYESISGQLREGSLDKQEEKLIESLRDAGTGFSIELPKIYFAFNQSELLPSSYPALEKLANILAEHKNLRIEIRGHTDNVGSNWYNKRLSNDRAESVYEFLIEAGIDEARLKYRGFGNKVPVADNDTEEGRQLNRRVEIKVISN